MFLNGFPKALPGQAVAILIATSVWSLAWKGLALWHAAQNKQLYWFIALIVLNTLGILEIIYLFGFAKKKMTLNDLSRLLKIK